MISIIIVKCIFQVSDETLSPIIEGDMKRSGDAEDKPTTDNNFHITRVFTSFQFSRLKTLAELCTSGASDVNKI